MTQTSRAVTGWVLAAAIGLATVVVVGAQERPEGASQPAPVEQPPAAEPIFVGPVIDAGPVLRVGQDYTLRATDTIRDAAVIAGTATIEGRVEGDLVIILGSVTLANTAVIEGSLIVGGGGASVATGALVYGDVVVVGGAFEAPAGFMPGGQHIVIGPAAIGRRFEAVVPWITRGLLWGRPIVPDLRWVWTIVGIVFLVYLAISLIFDQPVRACADKLAERPLSALLAGLLTLLLAGPVFMILAVTLVGLAVVPFVLCALVIAGLVGRIGVARWIGMRILRLEHDGRLQSIALFLIGFAVITLAYLVPVLGLVMWLMVGVFGLGAATMAVGEAYGRENPRRVRAVRTPPPPTPEVDAPAGAATVTDADAPAVGPLRSATAPAASDLASFPRAAFLDRVGAFVLDIALTLFVMAMLDEGPDERFFLLFLVYRIAFWAWKGATVGGIICQLRVVRGDGAPLGFPDALVRGLASIFSVVVLGLGCLWVLKDQERQAWHDKIAGTYVVKVPRNWPL